MTGTGIAGAADYVPRGQQERQETCWVCRGPVRMGGAASRVLPPLAVACSASCAASDRWQRPYVGADGMPSDRPAVREVGA